MSINYGDITAIGEPTNARIRDVSAHYNRIKAQFAERDGKMQQVLAVRQGRMRDVYPDLFPDGPFDQGIVANMVDVAARDLADWVLEDRLPVRFQVQLHKYLWGDQPGR